MDREVEVVRGVRVDDDLAAPGAPVCGPLVHEVALTGVAVDDVMALEPARVAEGGPGVVIEVFPEVTGGVELRRARAGRRRGPRAAGLTAPPRAVQPPLRRARLNPRPCKREAVGVRTLVVCLVL